MRTGTYAGIKLLRPFIAMNKAQIAAEARSGASIFARTWSCYKGGAVHCGKCGTCVERREALPWPPCPTRQTTNRMILFPKAKTCLNREWTLMTANFFLRGLRG